MSKRFGGMDLGSIVQSTQREAKASETHKAQVPIGELAVRGATTVPHERQTILLADPKRCRPWKFHNRHKNWYTREKCADLIEAFSKEEQLEPALGRKLEGNPDFDFELIFGMRRRFACEFLGKPLKLKLTTANDKLAAVYMHQENHDRQDITPMERAISYADQLRAKLFESQDDIAKELLISKAQVSKMVIAAELLSNPVISPLFLDPLIVPIKGAYELAVKMSDAASRKQIEHLAERLSSTDKAVTMTPQQILKYLGEPERATKTRPMKKPYNVGKTGRMVLTRNNKGKVTLAFPDGLAPSMEEDVLTVVRTAIKDLG
jgi:ParB family chromosome partitioning protein